MAHLGSRCVTLPRALGSVTQRPKRRAACTHVGATSRARTRVAQHSKRGVACTVTNTSQTRHVHVYRTHINTGANEAQHELRCKTTGCKPSTRKLEPRAIPHMLNEQIQERARRKRQSLFTMNRIDGTRCRR